MNKSIDVGVLIKNISDAIETNANTELAEFDLTVSQYRYLEYIQDNGGCASAKDIRDRFKVSQPTVAGILKRLRAKGYLVSEVSKDDERAKNLSITAAGENIVNRAGTHKNSTEERILSELSDAERKTIKELLLKVYEGLDQGGNADES